MCPKVAISISSEAGPYVFPGWQASPLSLLESPGNRVHPGAGRERFKRSVFCS